MSSFWLEMARQRVDVSFDVLDGVRTRVLEAGPRDAPPMVLLHGVGGHLEAFANNVAALSREHCVVAYDMPGHGWSDGPDDRSYEVDGYVRHLVALLEDRRIDRPVLCGVSLGGWVSARCVAAGDVTADGLILVGTGGATFDENVMASIKTLSTAASADPSPETVRARLEWLMADPAAVTDELVATRQAIYSQPGFGQRMQSVLCLQEPDVRRSNLLTPEEWASISCPTLVIWGSADRTAPASKGAEIARMIGGNAEFEEFPSSGHWPQFEDPARFESVVGRFLQFEQRGDSA